MPREKRPAHSPQPPQPPQEPPAGPSRARSDNGLQPPAPAARQPSRAGGLGLPSAGPVLGSTASIASTASTAASQAGSRLAIPHSYTVLATPNAYRDLGQSDMRRILRMVTFNDDYAAMTKEQRREIMREEDTPENAEKRRTVAAIEIQRYWRGFWTRAMLHDLDDGRSSIFPLHTRSRFADSELGLRDVKTPPLICREYLEAKYEEYLRHSKEARKIVFAGPPHTFEGFCVSLIQAWWRMLKQRRAYKKILAARKRAALVIERAWIRRCRRFRAPSREKAIRIIQRAWRRSVLRGIFRCYRDLVTFRERGDPALLLRCINPREAQLLDAASGAHVRFRLGGPTFPPTIYYKIFTHHTVVDLCASSPRDYCATGNKLELPRTRHNRAKVKGLDSTAGWYRRIENNGWRPVSYGVMAEQSELLDALRQKDAAQNFHPVRLVRRQDIERKKKRRRVEWMQKLYTGRDPNAKESASPQRPGIPVDDLDDAEAEQLVQWTHSLSFDDYVENWAAVGVTAPDNAPRAHVMQPTVGDPYKMRLDGGQLQSLGFLPPVSPSGRPQKSPPVVVDEVYLSRPRPRERLPQIPT